MDVKGTFLGHISKSITKLQQDLAETADTPLHHNLRERTLALLRVLLQSESPSEWIATRDLILAFAPKMEIAGFRDEWIPYLQRAIALSRQAGDQEGEASIGHQLGILYQVDSQWDSAIEILQSSGQYFLTSDQPRTYANILNRLGYIARNQGELGRAEQFATQALNFLKEDDKERHFSLFVLGVTASDKLQWKDAEHYYRQSLEICQLHNDFRNVARRHRDIGVAFDGQDNLRNARSYYEQAICMFEQMGDRFEAAVTKMNLGIVYSKLGNSPKALDYYADAEAVFRHIRDELHLGYVIFNQGVDYQELERFSEAEDKFKTAIEIRYQVSNPASVIYVQIVLGELYLQTGRQDDAFRIFDKALRQIEQIDDVSMAARYKKRIETDLTQLDERNQN